MKHQKRYSDFEPDEREFYFYLGLLSTKFSILEYNILKILGGLISTDFILSNTLLERNSLAQNLELLKKIYKQRKFEEKGIQRLIEQASDVKKKRNLFIHGLWGKPVRKENDLIIFCGEPKMDYTQEVENGIQISQSWKSITEHEFRLSYLKRLTERVSDIILTQDYLIKKLEEFDLE